MNRRFLRVFLLTLLVLIMQSCIGTIFWVALLTRPTADVRPDKIRISKQETKIDSSKGEEVFSRVLESYDPAYWKKIDSFQLEVKFEAINFTSKVFSPFPDNEAHLLVTYADTTLQNVKAEFLSGKRKGEVWELRNDTVFLHKTKGHTLVNPAGFPVNPLNRKRKIEHWLRFFGKVFGLPYYLETFSLKSYIDQLEYDWKLYDRILVSQENGRRSREFDQYILWVNQETGLIDRVDLTRRDLNKSLESRILYTNYHRVGELDVPYSYIAHTFKKDKPFADVELYSVSIFLNDGSVIRQRNKKRQPE